MKTTLRIFDADGSRTHGKDIVERPPLHIQCERDIVSVWPAGRPVTRRPEYWLVIPRSGSVVIEATE